MGKHQSLNSNSAVARTPRVLAPVLAASLSMSSHDRAAYQRQYDLQRQASIWADRMDWYFGADMAIYHTTGVNPRVPVVPDGFLSIGVERKKGGKSRKSYVLWEEQDIPPILVLEMVSHTPGGEYDDKLDIYTRLGVLYYVIYNPEFWKRDGHQPFEVYKLVNGEYQLQIGEPFWMPEIGLGIGRAQVVFGNIPQEQLAWYDETGTRYLTAEERADQERREKEQLIERLRAKGIDLEDLL